MKFERGDIVTTTELDLHKRGNGGKLIGIVIEAEPTIGVSWILCPPEENFRHIHPAFDRWIDEADWIEKIGHIDLDAASAAQEGEEHGNRRESETGS